MVDFASLAMSIDASGMVSGEQALDRMTRKGAQAEKSVTISTKNMGDGFNRVSTAANDAERSVDRFSRVAQNAGRLLAAVGIIHVRSEPPAYSRPPDATSHPDHH